MFPPREGHELRRLRRRRDLVVGRERDLAVPVGQGRMGRVALVGRAVLVDHGPMGRERALAVLVDRGRMVRERVLVVPVDHGVVVREVRVLMGQRRMRRQVMPRPRTPLPRRPRPCIRFRWICRRATP